MNLEAKMNIKPANEFVLSHMNQDFIDLYELVLEISLTNSCGMPDDNHDYMLFDPKDNQAEKVANTLRKIGINQFEYTTVIHASSIQSIMAPYGLCNDAAQKEKLTAFLYGWMRLDAIKTLFETGGVNFTDAEIRFLENLSIKYNAKKPMKPKDFCRKCQEYPVCNIHYDCPNGIAQEQLSKCTKCIDFNTCVYTNAGLFFRFGCYERREEYKTYLRSLTDTEFLSILDEKEYDYIHCPYAMFDTKAQKEYYQLLIDVYAPDEHHENMTISTAQDMLQTDLNRVKNNLSSNKIYNAMCASCIDRPCERQSGILIPEAMRRGLLSRVKG